jgi:hypothetical protein
MTQEQINKLMDEAAARDHELITSKLDKANIPEQDKMIIIGTLIDMVEHLIGLSCWEAQQTAVELICDRAKQMLSVTGIINEEFDPK